MIQSRITVWYGTPWEAYTRLQPISLYTLQLSRFVHVESSLPRQAGAYRKGVAGSRRRQKRRRNSAFFISICLTCKSSTSAHYTQEWMFHLTIAYSTTFIIIYFIWYHSCLEVIQYTIIIWTKCKSLYSNKGIKEIAEQWMGNSGE